MVSMIPWSSKTLQFTHILVRYFSHAKLHTLLEILNSQHHKQAANLNSFPCLQQFNARNSQSKIENHTICNNPSFHRFKNPIDKYNRMKTGEKNSNNYKQKPRSTTRWGGEKKRKENK